MRARFCGPTKQCDSALFAPLTCRRAALRVLRRWLLNHPRATRKAHVRPNKAMRQRFVRSTDMQAIGTARAAEMVAEPPECSQESARGQRIMRASSRRQVEGGSV
eukprot:NODE_22557_length_703_cov_5.645833.p2 GENE.NODE_22557_length_703_cov_5.645833~~NODE_22557_length_703_cov_5.645833.p2  ORF type:complete len:105 (+),score=16.43 NODE_22557_length_703_cov_5.645833:219-533(+)